jgi:hypothetical protein
MAAAAATALSELLLAGMDSRTTGPAAMLLLQLQCGGDLLGIRSSGSLSLMGQTR